MQLSPLLEVIEPYRQAIFTKAITANTWDWEEA